MRSPINHQSWFYLISLAPIYPIGITLNPLLIFFLLSRERKKISDIHPLFWLLISSSLIGFALSFFKNISNLGFIQSSHLLSLFAAISLFYILTLKLKINMSELKKIVFYLGLIYGSLLMLFASFSGLSVIDIGGVKALNFPGWPQRFSPILVLSFFAGITFFDKSSSKYINLALLASLIFILFVIFITFTRSLYLGFIASSLYFLTYTFIFKFSTKLKFLTSLIVISLALLLLLSLNYTNTDEDNAVISLFTSIISAFQNLGGSGEGTIVYSFYSSEYLRTYFWSLAMEIFYENPIFGTGYAGLYQYENPEFGSVHSQWIDQIMR